MRRIQRDGWDLAAGTYEAGWSRQLQPSIDAVLAAAALRPGDRVLDVACGTGLVTVAAATSVGPRGHVIATDIAPRMIDVVEARAAAAGLGNVDGLVCGAESIDIVDDVDVALCSLGLMYVPAPIDALRAMRRAVHAGGRMVASVWGERRHCGWAGIFPIVDARVSSDVCPMFFALGGRDALVLAVEQAGFIDPVEVRLRVELVYDNADAAVVAAFDGGPVALANARFDRQTRRSAHAEYLASIADYADAGTYRIPGEFVIVSARRP